MTYKYFLSLAVLIVSQICNSQNIEKGFYQIVSTEYQESVNIPRGSEKNGERLIIWDKNNCRFNQEWKFEKIHKGYIIRSKYNDKVITANLGCVIQNEFMNSESQYWLIKKTQGGFFIISKGNGLALSVRKTDSTTKELVLTAFNKNDSQKWTLAPSGLEYINESFNQVLAPEEMKADVEYFFNKLVNTHVNPYAFVPMDSLNKRKKAILDELQIPLKRYEFCRLVSSINGCFDGHTGFPDFDYDYCRAYLNNYGRILPFEFKYTPNHLYFDSEIDSLKHLEITSINNISFSKISSEIENRENLESRQMRNVQIQKNISNYLFGLFDIQSPYNIGVIDTISKKISKLSILGLPGFMIPTKISNKKDYEFRSYPKDSIAIIEYNTCAINDMEKFNLYIDSVFRVIKETGVKYLFIDISKNSGGNSSNNYIFYKNINHRPNPWTENYVMKLDKETKLQMIGLSQEELDKVIAHGNLSDYQKSVLEEDFHKLDITHCTDSVFNGYSKALYIIQSYWTYSAGTDMSAWFKYGHIGTLIGCETGGTSEVYIDKKSFILPMSKIGFHIAFKHSKYPLGKLNQGVLPDVDLGVDFVKDTYELADLKRFIYEVKTVSKNTAHNNVDTK